MDGSSHAARIGAAIECIHNDDLGSAFKMLARQQICEQLVARGRLIFRPA
jgi:tryptophan 2,3-dioxygenase